MQRGEREIMLMELPDFQKSQTHGLHTWQIAYADHKTWCWAIPDTLDFLNRPWTHYSEHALTTSTTHAPECGGIMCIILAQIFGGCSKGCSRKVQNPRCCSIQICFSCAVYSQVELCRSPSQSLSTITYLYQTASNISHQIFLARSVFAYQECCDGI